MKKALTFLLALVMVLSLCACGAGGETQNQANNEVTQTEPTETVAPSLEVESFFGEWINYENGDTLSISEKGLKLTYVSGASYETNLSAAKIEGNTITELNIGTFELVENEGYLQLVGDGVCYITIDEAKSREESESLSVGSTAKLDQATITLTDFAFSKTLGKDNTTRVFVKDKSWDGAPDGMTYMLIYFDYTNTAKEQVNITDVTITINYNDGFLFSSADGNKAYCFEDDVNGVYRKYGIDSGYVMELSPLQSGQYFACIPIADLAVEDTTLPLVVTFEIGNRVTSDEYEIVRYVISEEQRVEKLSVQEDDNAVKKDDIGGILTSHKWVRATEGDDAFATIEFVDDYTGIMSISDGEKYDLTWKAVKDGTFEITLVIDGEAAPAEYIIYEQDSSFCIQLVENMSFTYIAQ